MKSHLPTSFGIVWVRIGLRFGVRPKEGRLTLRKWTSTPWPTWIAIEIAGKRSLDKTLSELVANQDALRPDVRRFLVKRLRLRAEARRRQAQLELVAANHWDAVANQFKEDVTPRRLPPAWLNRRAGEPADPEFNLV
jgi:hypothetical protein